MPEKKTAPDGGPVSHARLKVTYTEQLSVKKKNGGRIIKIPPDSFDPKLHEKITKKDRERLDRADTERAAAERQAAEDQKRQDASDSAREQMAGMTIPALKELPEWEDVPEKADLKTKDQIIEALLKARGF